MSETQDPSRRAFVKRSLYVAPLVVTLEVAPAYAKAGSEKPDDGDGAGSEHPSHPVHPDHPEHSGGPPTSL
jgi:hypothetical protein